MPRLVEKKKCVSSKRHICCPKIRLEGITNVVQQSILEKLSVPTQHAGELQYNEHGMSSIGGRSEISESSDDLMETVPNLRSNKIHI